MWLLEDQTRIENNESKNYVNCYGRKFHTQATKDEQS